MADFREALRERTLVCDGAMGTQLRSYLQRSEPEGALELLNVTRPELVQHVHREYIEAGADIITTNTFGASSLRMRAMGREEETETINRRAVELARAVAESASRQIFVAGSVGPLGALRYPADVIRPEQMVAVYARQVRALVDAGVDALLVETMSDYREAVAATEAALASGLPVATHVVSEDGETVEGHIDLYNIVRKLESMGVDAVGLNCRIGPDLMIRIARKLASFASRPLCLQPNAGNLDVDTYGRMEIVGQPGAFASLARACGELGVGIVGGCCYTSPAHIAALRETLGRPPTADRRLPGEGTTVANDLARRDGESPSSGRRSAVGGRQTGPRPPSALAAKLAARQFVTCVEIDPPTDEEVQADPGILAYKVDGARYLEERCGVDVITVADHTMGRPWLDGFPFAEALRPHLRETDVLLHYTCRNKAETDIAGNFASFKLYGYRNLLIITGDRPPSDKAFYEYSSATLMKRIREEHGDYFLIAGSFDHNRGSEREGTIGIDAELRRLQRKVEAGAQVALTQPIYSRERVALLREKTAEMPIPILPGIMPILSPQHARTVNRFAGIIVPEEVIARMETAGEDRTRRAALSVEMATEIARAVRDAGFPGIYLITPLNRFDVIRRVLAALDQ
jgi:methionine synthase / methylenetetrahydrofolate reductase(NADPH)